MSPEAAGLIRLTDEVHRGVAVQAELPVLMTQQATHYASHAGFALDAIAADNLGGMMLHGEHTMNILVGRSGELYGDYDGSGGPVNPGDDVGLLPYVQLLEAAASGAAEAELERGGSGELARSIADRAGALVDQLLDARETIRQVLLADSIADIRQLGLDGELQAARALREQVDQLAAEARDISLTFSFRIGPLQ
jgi:hypothetical protein